MSRRQTGSRPLHRRFPRVSGDEPDGDTLDLASILFSPRERG